MIKKLDFIQDYKNFNYKTVKLGLAYNVAKLRGCDIDKPRNLAKSVTVEQFIMFTYSLK